MRPLGQALAPLWCALALIACEPAGSGEELGQTPDVDAEAASDVGAPDCTDGERRCVGPVAEICGGGTWVTLETCTAPTVCTEGACVADCTPACEDRECGDDGCGGSCGDCEEGWSCEAGACTPPTGGCGDQICGADEDCEGCPADCGCADGEACVEGACVCTPDCEGKVCGDDGCGGSCGDCEEGSACREGSCEVEGPSCGDRVCDPTEGCADCPEDCGGCCGDGACVAVQGENCATCGRDCGCGDGEVCDFERRDCGPACTPDCTGRRCGSDGCGGTCGECPGAQACSAAGDCVAPPERCGDGVCEGTEDCATCADDCGGSCCGDGICGAGENCGTCPDDCACEAGERCDRDRRLCVASPCQPSCEGRTCGPDGCGGLCGRCGGGRLCDPGTGLCGLECVPRCDGRACGPDGCGGSCGQCEDGLFCDPAGQCGEACVPQCEGAACGPDGCGGDCGFCGEEQRCSLGRCINDCVPDCEGKVCGDDGCAGSCGACGDDAQCEDGACVADCVPDCEGRVCGDNGCAGSCGACEGDDECVEGVCEPPCVPDCEGKVCGDDGCGIECGFCEDGFECEAGVCEEICVPECEGKVCGDNGCAGVCGDCGELFCSREGQCVEVCEPDCEGKVCGDDGCDGSCGPCGEGLECEEGACVEPCIPACEGLECGDDGCAGECGECGDEEICADGLCCEPSCEGRVCGDDGCGGSCGGCEDDLVCDFSGVCVPCDCPDGVCLEEVCRAPHELCAPEQVGLCPTDELCEGGQCVVVDRDPLCDDGNPCTADRWDLARGACVHEADDDLPCDDGDACSDDVCSEGLCVGIPIEECLVPPGVDPIQSPTNVAELRLTGTRPEGAAVVIDGEVAIPPEPGVRFGLRLDLVPGPNDLELRSEVDGVRSEARNVRVVYDPDAPTLRMSPAGGDYFEAVTVTVISDEPARIFYTHDGGTPDERARSFESAGRFRVFDEVGLRLRARDAAGNWSEELLADFTIGTARNGWSEAADLDAPIAYAGAASLEGRLYIAGGLDDLGARADVAVYDGEAWMNLPALPTIRTHLGLAALPGGLVAIGGLDDGVVLSDVNAIDPTGDDAWLARTPMPTARYGAAVVSVAGQIYVFGGRDEAHFPTTSNERYTLGTDQWAPLAVMPRARFGATAWEYDGRLYLFGGIDDRAQPVAEVDIYDPGTDQWAEGTPMLTPRYFMGAGVVRNVGEIVDDIAHLILAGGFVAGGTPTHRVEAYDFEAEAWRSRSPLDRPRAAAAGAPLVVEGQVDTFDEVLMLFGGQDAEGLTASATVYRHDRDFADPVAPLPEPRFLHHAFSLGDFIYVFGGRSFAEVEAGWVFDPEHDAYTDMSPLESAQNRAAAAEFEGLLYLIGGFNRFGVELRTTRVFDPVTGEWAEREPMPTGRGDAAVAQLEGELWVISGATRGEEFEEELTATVDIYDPRADAWREGPPLPEPRVGALAVGRGDAIYVFGGLDAGGAAINTVLRLDGENWAVAPGDTVSTGFAAGVPVGDHVYAIFGGRQAEGPIARALVYDFRDNQARESQVHGTLPARDRWAVTSHMGRLYLMGGNETVEVGPEGRAEALRFDARCFDGIQEEDERGVCGGPRVTIWEGPRTNVPVAELEGWETCWTRSFNSNSPIAEMLAACDGEYVMMGCRPNGAASWTLAAMGERDEVFRDTGPGNHVLHTHNGVDWYHSGSQSIGFVLAGTGVSRNSCDTGSNRPEMRMCWHTSGNNITNGYRCGQTTSVGGWERAVLQPR